MSAVDQLFAELRQRGGKALMPFVTAGDPDLQFTADVLRRLQKCGCHLFELGLPYSDPIADGPVIQASYTRALDHGTRLQGIWQMLEMLQPELRSPLVTMTSYAIIYRTGVGKYIEQAKQRGVSGLIVPDMLVEESHELSQLCQREDLSLIQLVTPTTPRERAKRIAAATSGFIYYVSVTGITGERNELPAELRDNVLWLREQTSLPICIGFGISSPEHVTTLAPIADGLIVGSAFVRRIAAASDASQRQHVLDDVEAFARSLLAALPT